MSHPLAYSRDQKQMTDLSEAVSDLPDKSLLVLDDDAPLRTRLGRALEGRGFAPTLVASVAEAISAVKLHAPAFAVVDMRLEDGNGLGVVEAIHAARPDARVIMLTGYGNIERGGRGEGGGGGLPAQTRRRR